MPKKLKQVYKNKVKRYGFIAVGISLHSHKHCIAESWIQIGQFTKYADLDYLFLNLKYQT